MDVRPFPLAALDKLTRAEVDAARRLRRAARQYVRTDALVQAVSEIAKEKIEVLVRRHRRADERHSSIDAVGLTLAIDAHRTGERVVVIEADAALAALLTAKALARPAPRFLDATRPPPAALTGAFAAVAVTCLRRAHAGSSFRIVSAGPATALVRDLLAQHRATTAFLTVVVGADAFDVRVTMPDAATFALPEPVFDLETLGEAPISVPIVATTCLARRSEIASLVRGDAFVAPRLDMKHVVLVPPYGERGLAADLAEGPRLVVRGLLESHPWEAPEMGNDTTSKTTRTPTEEVLEDAAVVVRVEIGAVEMKAREWAALSPGDVVTLGRKLGEPAILRVGGVEVARGELVQVDGEYGVRIL